MSAAPFSVPKLSVPFPDNQHPAVESINDETVVWAARHRLYADTAQQQRFHAAQLGHLAGHTCPRASTPAVRYLADWYTWFLIIDAHSEHPEAGALVRLLALNTMPLNPTVPAERVPTTPLTSALQDLWRRTAELASPEQQRRLAQSLHYFYFGLVWEAGQRANDWQCSLIEATAMRPYTAAIAAWLVLIEIARGYQLDPHTLARPDLALALSEVADATVLINDVFSYPKEQALTQMSCSIPMIFQRHNGLTHQEALDRTGELFDQSIDRYQAAESRIRSWADPVIAEYLNDMRLLIAGTLRWHEQSRRYATYR